MGSTDQFEDIVTAKWAPGDYFSIHDVYGIEKKLEVGCSRSTVQRSMQELRDRNVVEFIDNNGSYRRVPTQLEKRTLTDNSKRSHLVLAEKTRKKLPHLHELIDNRIQHLKAHLTQQQDTNLRDVPVIIEATRDRTETATRIMARLGQDQFRYELISFWKKCAVTECELLPVLRASHIKPWSVSDDTERLDIYNGLLLVSHLDALFDEGFITFDDNGQMIVSSVVSNEDRKLFGIPSRKSISIVDKHLPYLKYHREVRFLGIS